MYRLDKKDRKKTRCVLTFALLHKHKDTLNSTHTHTHRCTLVLRQPSKTTTAQKQVADAGFAFGKIAALYTILASSHHSSFSSSSSSSSFFLSGSTVVVIVVAAALALKKQTNKQTKHIR